MKSVVYMLGTTRHWEHSPENETGRVSGVAFVSQNERNKRINTSISGAIPFGCERFEESEHVDRVEYGEDSDVYRWSCQ